MSPLAQLGAQLLDDGVGLLAEPGNVQGKVIVGSDERGGRGQVIQYDSARPPLRSGPSLRLAQRLDLAAVGSGSRFAPLRCNPRHAGSGEAVQNEVARLGVVEDRWDNRKVGNLGMVRVGLVNRVVLSLRHVDGHWLPAVAHAGVIRFPVAPHELSEERVRARCVVRRVGHCQDGFVGALRKPFGRAKHWVFELLGQQFQEVLAPGLLVQKCLAEAFDGALPLRCSEQVHQAPIFFFNSSIKRMAQGEAEVTLTGLIAARSLKECSPLP